jgi:stage II sporulation protein P
MQYELQKKIIRFTEEMYMPGMAYLKNGGQTSVLEWLESQALWWMPLVTYVDAAKPYESVMEDDETIAKILEAQASHDFYADEEGNGSNVVTQGETRIINQVPVDTSIDLLRDYNYLISNLYTVSSETMIAEGEIDADTLLAQNMSIDTSTADPKVFIFHSHSQEAFVDSVEGDSSTTIVGMGAYLAELLNAKGIVTVHDAGVYDIIDGQLDRSNAYENAEENLRPYIDANPSIEVVIDLHRDGVSDNNTKLVTDLDGKQTAQLMFFNGLSRTKTNGDIAYLYNPYKQENLAFSLQMKLATEELFPGIARRIYLAGYRYNLHWVPKSLLVEAGAQTNTVEEMRNAMEVLADTLAYVLTGSTEGAAK